MNAKQIYGNILADTLDNLTDEQRAVLTKHEGHKLELVVYANKYYAIECTNCCEVLFDDEILTLDNK